MPGGVRAGEEVSLWGTFALNFSLPFILLTDALNRGLEAVLSQQVSGAVDRPIVYISRKLCEWEARWYGGERVPGHPVGGRLSSLLPPGPPLFKLFRFS